MNKIYIFFLLTLVPPAYLCTRCLHWKDISRRIKAVICLFFIVCSQMMLINHLVFKSVAGPDMPSWLLLLQAVLFASEVFLFLFFLARDVFFLARRLLKGFHRKRHPRELYSLSVSRREFFKYGLYTGFFTMGASLTSLGISATAVRGGTADPILHKMELMHPDLPPALDGLRLLHASDIHIGTLTGPDWARNLVNLANAQHPDIVCLSGDLSDGLPEYVCTGGGKRIEAAKELANLAAPLGVFACPGNHEYYGNYEVWSKVYHDVGINMLEDDHVVLEFNGYSFAVAGRADRAIYRIGKKSQPAASVLGSVPDGLFTILLDHRPIRAKENAAAGAALQLSGHTHGGQCVGMDKAVKASNEGFLRGWYNVDSMPMYVTTGAGLWSGFPLRLGVPAEISLIVLRKETQGTAPHASDI